MLVNNKRLNILNIGGEYKLMPGVQDVPGLDAKKWDDLQKRYPKVKQLVDDDLLEVREGGSSSNDEGDAQPQGFRRQGAPTAGNTDLSRFREKDAIRLVKETADDALLQQWHEAEERPAVIRAIEDQFSALARAGEPK